MSAFATFGHTYVKTLRTTCNRVFRGRQKALYSSALQIFKIMKPPSDGRTNAHEGYFIDEHDHSADIESHRCKAL